MASYRKAAPWNPETHPYRVSWLSFGRGLPHGWGRHSRTFATADAAKAAASEPFGPGVKDATIHVVDGEVPKNWRWKQLARRRRGEQLVDTPAGC